MLSLSIPLKLKHKIDATVSNCGSRVIVAVGRKRGGKRVGVFERSNITKCVVIHADVASTQIRDARSSN